MTPEECHLEWLKQHISLAKLLLTLAVAASASLLAWAVQNRRTEEEAIVALAFIASAGFGVAGAAMLGWAGAMLRKLKEDVDGND